MIGNNLHCFERVFKNMTEKRSKVHQKKRTVEEKSYLEQIRGKALSLSAENHENQKMVPVQFYMTNDMKRRLKMYCLSNDTKMTDVLNRIVNDFLTSNEF